MSNPNINENNSDKKPTEPTRSAHTNNLSNVDSNEEIGNRWDFAIGLDSNGNLFPIHQQEPLNTTSNPNNAQT
ncbi:hypothetical protein [Fischerella sp. PCC 9605]|uniref:hypothetical protein n=1 Tax=Fischerella sp. PCC 9605 TaxID=1173024 RepID=UPI0004794BF7|nr:hypothetical protein [Fischerella sp. PCC 9605]